MSRRAHFPLVRPDVPKVALIVAANAVLSAALLVTSWGAAELFLLFWAENAIVALALIVKADRVDRRDVTQAFGLPLVYAGFVWGHLVLLRAILFDDADVGPLLWELRVPLALLLATHVLALWRWWRRTPATMRLGEVVAIPIVRTGLLHAALVVVGLAAVFGRVPEAALVVIIVAKAAAEILLFGAEDLRDAGEPAHASSGIL